MVSLGMPFEVVPKMIEAVKKTERNIVKNQQIKNRPPLIFFSF